MSDVFLDRWFVAQVDKLEKNIDETMEQIAEEGQNLLQTFIESRGTANPKYGGKSSWRRTYYRAGGGPKSGPTQGRVWSGEMRADIEQASARTKRLALASFGWLYNFQDYYAMQEEGFSHPFTGEDIPGMFIMADAEDLMEKRAAELIGATLERF